MNKKQLHNQPRVHLRALARLQVIHETLSAGSYPSVQEVRPWEKAPRYMKAQEAKAKVAKKRAVQQEGKASRPRKKAPPRHPPACDATGG